MNSTRTNRQKILDKYFPRTNYFGVEMSFVQCGDPTIVMDGWDIIAAREHNDVPTYIVLQRWRGEQECEEEYVCDVDYFLEHARVMVPTPITL